jgi:hypothetical protein
MNNFEFLSKIEELQTGIMHAGHDNFPYGKYFYGIEDKSSFWNHLLTNQLLSQPEIEELSSYATGKQLKPAVYFENDPRFESLEQILVNNKFKKIAEDSWMFYNSIVDYQAKFDLIKKVENPEDLKIYIDVFDKCYQKNDPQNVYGELGDYLKSASRSWFQNHGSNYQEYYLIFDGHEPVAVSALTNYLDVGYISNVGSLKKVRGQGYGKIATLFAVYQSQKNGNKYHCLATEENTYANEFYKKNGFTTKFTALLFEKP